MTNKVSGVQSHALETIRALANERHLVTANPSTYAAYCQGRHAIPNAGTVYHTNQGVYKTTGYGNF